MTTLTLYDFPAFTGVPGWESFSPYVLGTSRALRATKLPFEKRSVSVFRIKEFNPLGQLPVLAVGNEYVADSTRILQRLEALAPGSMLGGLGARETAEAWLWEEFADTALYPYVLTTRWADDRGWPVVRDRFFASVPAPVRAVAAPMVRRGMKKKLYERDFTRAGIDACYERLGRVLDALDARAPEEGFWMGARLSVADFGLFGQLHSLRLPLIPWQAETLARRARLCRYLDRVDSLTRPPAD